MLALTINAGSSSIKYQIVDSAGWGVLSSGKVERVGEAKSHADAVREVIEQAKQHSIGVVGHRVVHGGEAFHDAAIIDDAVLARIEACVPLAPLHNPHNLSGIRAAQSALPGVPQVAVFDTAFHARMPRRARSYAIDPELAARHHIRRYGFHGTSHAYVSELAARYLKRPLAELRLVSLHLGNGASACAVEFGHSTETSMGMTPLEGLVMGTRSGDLDPGVLLALLREGMSADDLDRILNHESGLLGLSGVSMDLRDIETRAAEGDDRSRLAISVFAHRVKKYLGAYAATMGGLDAVVLTGGIGENSASMRRRILQRLDFLGLAFDDEMNQDARVSSQAPVARVSGDASRVAALVVKTDEELMIAQQSVALVEQKAKVNNPRPIPIAISARHLHLDAETFAKLFGEGKAPTKYKDISQPGQYACEEKLNLIGPRGRIDGVRLLGPLRPKNQVEVSRTDEFKLGVDAPIRDSGKVDGSAPITLEGPAGTVHLEQGLICAKRHIHMSPDDASHYGVVDGDEVEVAISGGPRDLTFGDVLIRVSPKYKLEMHIDTDEGNAGELNQGAQAEMVYEDVRGATASLRIRRNVR